MPRDPSPQLRQRDLTAPQVLLLPCPRRRRRGRVRHRLGQRGPPVGLRGHDVIVALPEGGLAAAGGHQRVEELQAGLVDGGGAGDGDAGLVAAAGALALKFIDVLLSLFDRWLVCVYPHVNNSVPRWN